MKFKKGDIVICTGWDDIQTDVDYDNKNVLDYYGIDRYDTFEVNESHPNYNKDGDTIISFNSGLVRDFGLNEKYFTLFSEYREEQLNKLL